MLHYVTILQNFFGTFLTGFDWFRGMFKSRPIEEGQLELEEQEHDSSTGLVLDGTWLMADVVFGLLIKPEKVFGKASFCHCAVGQLLLHLVFKIIPHPQMTDNSSAPSDVQSASLMRSIGTELGPVGPSGRWISELQGLRKGALKLLLSDRY